MNRHDADEFCRHKAAPPGSNFYYSILFYPELLRRKLRAVQALGVELEDIIAQCSDPGVMRMKLAWWREEITRLYQQAARHPVSLALEPVISSHGIQEEDLLQLICGYEQLGGNPVSAPWQDFPGNLGQGPGRLWGLAAEICGHQEPETIRLAADMGSLFCCFRMLQQPLRTGSGIAAPGNSPERAIRIKGILEKLEYNCSIFPASDRFRQLHILIMGSIISNTCREILRENAPEEQRLALTPLRKLWIAWRLQRRYRNR